MDTELKANFKVRVGGFEGPLELLLDLVEKRRLHISDVSLSQVADEFIEHIKSFEEFPIADSADFILVASTLLLIKSKSLLPNLPLSEEEEGNIEDLERRLAVYKRYKELASGIEKMFGNFLYFAKEKPARAVGKEGPRIFYPTAEITPLSLQEALSEAFKNMPQKAEELPKVNVEKIVSLEDMIEKLSERMEKSIRTSFSDFAHSTSSGQAGSRENRINTIVSFLAMLELVKQGMVRVSQEKHFDDIEIESESAGVPAYY